MTKDKALRLALEALQNNIHYTQTHLQDFDAAYNRHPSTEHERSLITDDIEDAFAAITTIKQALAHPKPEPVAWTDIDFTNIYISEMVAKEKSADVPLYTSPPKHEWQGLTDDEMQKIIKLVAQKCAEIADTAEPYQSADLIRKHFGVEK